MLFCVKEKVHHTSYMSHCIILPRFLLRFKEILYLSAMAIKISVSIKRSRLFPFSLSIVKDSGFIVQKNKAQNLTKIKKKMLKSFGNMKVELASKEMYQI